MNARSQVFEIAVEARQVEEAIARYGKVSPYFGAWLIILIAYLKISFSIFHTVLFHSSFGKFTYQDDSSYIIGTIGYEDVDCDYIGGKELRIKERFVFFSNI